MNTSSPTTRIALYVGVAGGLSLVVVGFVVPAVLPLLPIHRPWLTLQIRLNLYISLFTGFLLGLLFLNYGRIYRTTPSSFTRSLLVFTGLLGLYVLTSNPLVPVLFGLRVVEIGLFAFLPDIFTCVAITVLLHQSLK